MDRGRSPKTPVTLCKPGLPFFKISAEGRTAYISRDIGRFLFGETMPSLELLTTKFKNVATELSMTANTKYRFMNSGPGEITIVFSATEPTGGASDFIYTPRHPDNSETLVYDGTIGIWARALNVPGKISINGVIL